MVICDLAAGRAFPCKDAIGGIKDVYFIALGDASFGDNNAGTVSNIGAAMTMYRYELLKNTGSFVQTISDTMANGGLFYTQVLTIQFPKLDAFTNDELNDLLKNRLAIVIRDSNNNTHIMGYNDGAEATGGSLNTGAAKGDMQGYELIFTAEEAQPAPFFIDMQEGSEDTPGFDITVNTGGVGYTIAG